MSEADLEVRVRGLEVQMSTMTTTQALNHTQNRKDIHDIRGILQTLVDKITNMEIKNGRWSLGAGVLTATVVEAIRYLAAHH